MKRKVTGAIAALAVPAAAAGFFLATAGPAAASTATAVTTAAITKAPPHQTQHISVQAGVSNSRPKDGTTVHVNVTTEKGARVTTVAHFKTGNQVQTTTANSRGEATVAYNVGNARPGSPVSVTVTATYGSSHATAYTSFVPQR
jgi:hypothetical protein